MFVFVGAWTLGEDHAMPILSAPNQISLSSWDMRDEALVAQTNYIIITPESDYITSDYNHFHTD